MIKKKDAKTSNKKAIDDVRIPADDFRRRFPYESYRTVYYSVPDSFIRLGLDLDKYLLELFKGEIDEGNGDVLDNLIFDAARSAQSDLLRQAISHRDLIEEMGVRFAADHEDFKHMVADEKERLEAYERELRYVNQSIGRFNGGDAYENEQ